MANDLLSAHFNFGAGDDVSSLLWRFRHLPLDKLEEQLGEPLPPHFYDGWCTVFDHLIAEAGKAPPAEQGEKT